MAYRDCHNCGKPVENPPTIYEDLRDGQFCPHCKTQLPNDRSAAQWMVEMWEWCSRINLTGQQPDIGFGPQPQPGAGPRATEKDPNA